MAIRDHPTRGGGDGDQYLALQDADLWRQRALYRRRRRARRDRHPVCRRRTAFTFLLSVSFLVGLVVGGVGSIPGSLFGGLFVLFVPNIAESVSTGLSGAIYGVILLLVIFVMPSGAAGLRAAARRAWRSIRTGHQIPRENKMKSITRRSILAAAPAASGARRRAGARRKELRPRRHRHRDQDRQYRAV